MGSQPFDISSFIQSYIQGLQLRRTKENTEREREQFKLDQDYRKALIKKADLEAKLRERESAATIADKLSGLVAGSPDAEGQAGDFAAPVNVEGYGAVPIISVEGKMRNVAREAALKKVAELTAAREAGGIGPERAGPLSSALGVPISSKSTEVDIGTIERSQIKPLAKNITVGKRIIADKGETISKEELSARMTAAGVDATNARTEAEREISRNNRVFDRAVRLGNEFQQAYKPYAKIDQMRSQILVTTDAKKLGRDPTPMDDTATIYSFITFLDDQSTVREGERDLVAQARSKLDFWENLLAQVRGGSASLTPVQREEIRNATNAIWNSGPGKNARDAKEAARDQARRWGVDPGDVMGRFAKDGDHDIPTGPLTAEQYIAKLKGK